MEKLVAIGRTQKPNGLDGGMRVAVEAGYLGDFLGAEVLFLEEKGQPVPYFVEWLDGDKMMVGLDGVETKEAASLLSNVRIFLREEDISPQEESPLEKEEESSLAYAQYVGYQIVDAELGAVGPIQEIIAYPQQEMAVLKHQGREVLIPLNEQLITHIDDAREILRMSLPEGLLSI